MDIPRSTNQFTKFVFAVGTNSWEGTNLGGEAFGVGNPFGVGEFGGISHFQNITKYNVNH